MQAFPCIATGIYGKIVWLYAVEPLYQDISEFKIPPCINRTLFVSFVYLTIFEMRTPHYSGHFNLIIGPMVSGLV